MGRSLNDSLSIIGNLLLFLSGIILFTFLLPQKGSYFLLSILGLVISALAVSMHVKNWSDLKESFGLHKIRKGNIYFVPVAILLSLFFSMYYRFSLNIDIIPTHFISFAIVAAMIGATEELIFRGYIQFRSRDLGVVLSILIAAIAHTVYKYIVFISLPAVEPVNIGFLVFWTMFIGLILGVMKEISRSTYIPIIFHSLFDILVYGDGTISTWWVFA
jgi:membrane protease YdiL (CAAX protease family)